MKKIDKRYFKRLQSKAKYRKLSSVTANQDPAYFRLPEPLILFTNKSVTANEESVIQ